ncbi:hypothetical protein [Paraflavitalea sp. CAU 1676]|uniref:hypothetical protein n=1 Tax=Paraflavitalea sp. CAU 1676 TaxID=3032598 RepID=UPI0023DA44C3|nr:hypothetical protein [Paraflavitalea sp. CAU 1676]MDF2191095.1 hypothetical protein [Paraflavitalea sp. CAU 1676]
MKKILSALAIAGLFTVFACQTPEPATNPNKSDTTINKTQPDTTVAKPDSASRQ